MSDAELAGDKDEEDEDGMEIDGDEDGEWLAAVLNLLESNHLQLGQEVSHTVGEGGT